MARSDVTKQHLAGFVEKLINDAGVEQIIDYKKEFGPMFEEFMRENQWMKLMDWTYGDEERVVSKINYKAIRDTEVDFDPTTKAAGATVTPEEERIKIEQVKEMAAKWYNRDFEKSNGYQTVGDKITGALFRAPDSKMDIYISSKFDEYSRASTVTPLELDVDALAADMTPSNGETLFVAIKNQLMTFIKSAETNDYAEGSKYDKSWIKMAISVEVEELLTSYKSGFIDQSGLLNVGVFGAQFRNVQIETMTEMPEGTHVIFFTKRAIQGTFIPSVHTKVVPEAVNQTSYQNEVNVVYGYGMKEVFTNESTAIIQPAVLPTKKN